MRAFWHAGGEKSRGTSHDRLQASAQVADLAVMPANKGETLVPCASGSELAGHFDVYDEATVRGWDLGRHRRVRTGQVDLDAHGVSAKADRSPSYPGQRHHRRGELFLCGDDRAIRHGVLPCGVNRALGRLLSGRHTVYALAPAGGGAP